MELNMSVLHDALSDCYKLKRYGPENRTPCFGRPVLYETGKPMVGGTLYVARVADLPSYSQSGGVAIICVGRQIDWRWTSNDQDILLVTDNVSYIDVFNRVQMIFNHFDQWNSALLRQLGKEQEFEIKRVIALGVEILENPICVMDSNLHVILSSNMSADGSFSVSDEPYCLGDVDTTRIKEGSQLERMLTVPYQSAIVAGEERSYCSNLYPLGHFAGCVWVQESNRPFRESDFFLAGHFFNHFQQAFMKYLQNSKAAQSVGSSAIRNLLQNRTLTTVEMESFALEPGQHWACFLLRECPGGRAMPKDYMCATLNVLIAQDVFATLHQDSVVGLIRLSSDGNVLELFSDILRRMEYYAGLSNPFTQLDALEDALLEANFVAEYLQSIGYSSGIHRFSDYALPFLLNECINRLPIDALLSDGLRTLHDSDVQRGTAYIKTLRVLLEHEMNVSQTAMALYIHRSSLMKRLGKIYQILGHDLSDVSDRLYFRMCFALWEEAGN